MQSVKIHAAPSLTMAGEELLLLPERAGWWPARETLLVADVHWGKGASFRSLGVAVPRGTTVEGLGRLSRALERTGASRIVFLGDLWHDRRGRAPRTIATIVDWRAAHPSLELLLVRGNHDRHAGDPPEELRIACVDAPHADGPFEYRHHPEVSGNGRYVLAGHIHPAVRLRGSGRQRARMPCFWFGERIGVLPSFGDFTGSARVDPAPEDRVFVVADSEVIEVGG